MIQLPTGFHYPNDQKIGDKIMTREEAKQLLPIIQAFAEGKRIEYGNDDDWSETDTPTWSTDFVYRIKPEPKYRPFKSQEECLQEMLKHQPFGWLKSKKNGRFHCIGEVSLSDEFKIVTIALSTSESLSRSSDSVYKEYTFADNSPFGIKEE